MSTTLRPRRWLMKKAGRAGIGSVGSLMRLGRRGGPRVRVLTYHRFGTCPRDPYCVAPADFDAQMRFLAERKLAICIGDLQAFLEGKARLPDGAVLVTSDDGFRSVLTEMLPVLRRYGVPAVAFVSSSLVGSGQTDGAPEPYMSWNELRRLAVGGVTIGSHAVTHRSLAQLSREEARHEAAESRRRLEMELDDEVRAFAYPYGTLADFDGPSARILEEAGYRFGFTSQHGAIRKGERDWLTLPRIKVEAGDPAWLFPRLCGGAMDAWRMVDTLLWRTQQIR